MSRLGAKTYSRKPECKTSVQFDHLLADKGNKPSTAKVSVAAVHRWGMTSFTSLRKTHLNGQKDVISDNNDHVKRVKLEPKTSASCTDDPFSFESDIESPALKLQSPSQHIGSTLSGSSTFLVDVKSAPPKPNKFFKSSGARLLVAGANPVRKPDFDALRLSVSTNCGVKNEDESYHQLSNKWPSSQSSNSQMSDKSAVLFKSASPSEAVHLRLSVNTPSTCASTQCFNKPNVLYSSQFPDELHKCSNVSNVFGGNMRTYSFPQSKSSLIDLNSGPSSVQSDMEGNVRLQECDVKHDVCRTNSNEKYFNDTTGYNVHDFANNPIVLTEQRTLVEEIDLTGEDSQTSDAQLLECASKQELELNAQTIDTISYSLPDPYDGENNGQNLKEKHFIKSNSFPADSRSTQDKTQKTQQIFRSKKIFSNPKKNKAVYNHRHWQASKEQELLHEKESENQPPAIADEFEDETGFGESMTPVLCKETLQSKSSGETINSVRCSRKIKELYTVVRNVKQAYQCHESGETQEFNDDIEYLLESVQECNGIGTRCLSVLSLATKCMGPAFRIHLRAHGTMPKIFSALQDAPSDPNMSLCTATLMFVLSQDRLTMDIEASTLSLMLQLLETDPEIGTKEKDFDVNLDDPALCAMQEKHTEKVYQLCEQMQQKGHAKHLKLNNINTGILAMETLLSLTSRKAGEWFKEEIRTLHGLDHIVDTVTSCVTLLIPEELEVITHPTETQLDKIRKIDRCLRVLENVTYMNFENQDYLINYRGSLLITSCLSLLKLCKSHLMENHSSNIDISTEGTPEDTGKKLDSPILSCLLSLLKVLLNITHENPLGSSQVGSEEGLMEHVLICILQVPRAVSSEKRFDLLVLSLGLMINLVEHCSENRKQVVEMYVLGSFDTINDGFELPAVEALIEVLLSRLEAARQSEEQADALLSSQEDRKEGNEDGKDTENATTQADDLEETLMKTLQKAGKHMEHSIIAAYIALLLGCVIENNQDYADILRDHVPDGKFDVMVDVLRKFLSFVSLTGVVGNTGVKSIQRIIEVLESS